MPEAKALAASGTVGNKVYLLGGSEVFGEVWSSAHVYDPASDSWSAVADMPAPRTWSAVAVHDGLIYVFGGGDAIDEPAYYADAPPSSSVFVLDPVADAWTEKADMPFVRWAMVAGVVEGKIYLIGGSDRQYSYKPYFSEVWEYDPEAAE